MVLWEKLAERYKDNPGLMRMISMSPIEFYGTNQNGCDETSNALRFCRLESQMPFGPSIKII
jgi:hypothetical protein